MIYGDIRDESYTQCDGRILQIKPDEKMDVTALPFNDESFALVVYDPPHLKNAGAQSYMAQSYGVLPKEDPLDFLARGFAECWRVLKLEGTLIFKWSEKDIPLHVVLKALGRKPLLGNRRPRSQTFWLLFFKEKQHETHTRNRLATMA